MSTLKSDDSGLSRISVPVLVEAAEELKEVTQRHNVSVAKLVECLLKCGDDKIGEMVREHLPAVEKDRTAARLARREAKIKAQNPILAKVKTMNAAELAQLENMISQVSAGKAQ